MDFVAFLWLASVSIGAAAFGGALGVLGMNPARYKDAKILFIISVLSVWCIAVLFGITIPAPTIVRILGTGAIGAFAAIVAVESLRWVANVEQAAQRTPLNTGILSPATHLLFAPDGQGTIPTIQIGESQVFFASDHSNPYNAILLPALREQHFKAELVDGKIKISARIADEPGNVIVEIDRNEWKVAPYPGTWDRNYNNLKSKIRRDE
ncbi:MAG: hypothetical protein WCC90_11855 [Methylocella sp.]